MEKLKKEIQSAVNVYKSRDLSKAEKLCKKLILDNPNIAFLYNLLGLIYVDQKKIDDAIESYEKGIKIDQNFAMIYNNLGLLYYNYRIDGNIKKIEDYYKKAISLNEQIPEPHSNLGSLYNYLNKFNEAINCHKTALKIKPDFFYSLHNLGNIYVLLGDFEKAKKSYQESIKLNPNFHHAHRALSRLIKYEKNDKHYLQLEKIYKEVQDDDENKMNISFALAKAYDDMKVYDKSFSLYKEANFLYRKKIIFSIDLENKKFKEIKDIYNKNLFKKYANYGYKDKSPIFIVGMPRSGTTLVEQIISSHKKVFGADEIDFIPKIIKKNFGNNNLRLYFEGVLDFNENIFKKIGEEYINLMDNLSMSSERSTDKLPENFLSIGFIKLILPNSKIVHCYRNPRDNCISIFKSHFPGGKVKFAYNFTETIHYYNLYSDLMKHWNNLFPEFIYNIEYEKLINNSENEIKKLIKACDLNWDEACLNFDKNKRPIRTASDTQARSKIYNSSLNTWKNYEKYLINDLKLIMTN